MKIFNSLPVNSILYERSKKSSYKDSVKMMTKRDSVQRWGLVAVFFHSAPVWMKYLLNIRNRVVKHFGLKVGGVDEGDVSPSFEISQQFGVFKG